MLEILKTEFSYHRRIFGGFACTIPLFSLYAAYPIGDNLHYELWMVYAIFSMLIYWFTYRSKERREYTYTILPISLLIKALARILIVVIGTAVFLSIFFLILILLNPAAEFDSLALMKSLAVMVSIFAVYFLTRDVLYDFFRQIGFNKQRTIFGALLLTLGLNFLTVISVIQLKQTGKTFIPIGPAFDYLLAMQPFDGPNGIWKFSAFCSAGLFTTVFTYLFRRSYLDY